MSRHPADPAPAPLQAYCQQFDDLFQTVNQRKAFRRSREGLLLPAERTKALTMLANAKPIVGAQQPSVQRLQWFLSESSWQPAVINRLSVSSLWADEQIYYPIDVAPYTLGLNVNKGPLNGTAGRPRRLLVPTTQVTRQRLNGPSRSTDARLGKPPSVAQHMRFITTAGNWAS